MVHWEDDRFYIESGLNHREGDFFIITKLIF